MLIPCVSGHPNRNEGCLADLRKKTDPRQDKERINATKGGLYKRASNWILDHKDFRRWCDDDEAKLLWIKADPGLERHLKQREQSQQQSAGEIATLSYFFCQATDTALNNAAAVLCGLIYLLVEQQTWLISHVLEEFGPDGKLLSREANTWVTLSNVLKNILHDEDLKNVCLVIDALDECETDLPQLLKFIVDNSSTSLRVKWIVSSRNRPDIEQHLKLDDSGMKLSLEVEENAEQVAYAVNDYIDFKVSEVPSLQDDDEERHQIQDVMRQKANGTFLWVALVIKELEEPDCLEPLQVVREVPADLYRLYERILGQIWRLQKRTLHCCQAILAVVTLAYRPLHIAELSVLLGQETSKLRKYVEFCGSFLTVQGSHIFHQ